MKTTDWLLPFDQIGFGAQMRITLSMTKKDGTKMDVDFTFDTGNIKTCISKITLKDLGFEQEMTVAMRNIISKSVLADNQIVNNAIINLPNVAIGNLQYNTFAFELAHDLDKDYNNLLGLDVIENFNAYINFDDAEIVGELRALCELRTIIESSSYITLEATNIIN